MEADKQTSCAAVLYLCLSVACIPPIRTGAESEGGPDLVSRERWIITMTQASDGKEYY